MIIVALEFQMQNDERGIALDNWFKIVSTTIGEKFSGQNSFFRSLSWTKHGFQPKPLCHSVESKLKSLFCPQQQKKPSQNDLIHRNMQTNDGQESVEKPEADELPPGGGEGITSERI